MATNGVFYSQYSGFTISTDNTKRIIVTTGGTTIISGDTLDGKVIDVRGINGPLFSVDDNILGNILSVVNTTEQTVFNVNDDSVGIGINGEVPTNKLHISASTDPIRVIGFQESSDDTVITIDGSGVLHKLPISSISGITITGTFLPLSGGTVTGDTVFQSGLTATTISATTYDNIPIPTLQQVLDSGNTADNQSITINFSAEAGSNQVYLVSTAGDFGLYVYYLPEGNDHYQSYYGSDNLQFNNLTQNKNIIYGIDNIAKDTNTYTYPNNTGYLALSVNGYTADTTGNVSIPLDYLPLSGGTITGNTIFDSGLTANTIYATIYENLPIIPGEYLPLSGGTVTGGTVFQSGLTASTIYATIYENLPDNVTGRYLPISGGTVTGNTIFQSALTANTIYATIYENLPDNVTGRYLPISGGTVTGATRFTGGLTANTISATTYSNLPNTLYTGDGTIPTNRNVNISGWTLTFSGLGAGTGYVRVLGKLSNGGSSANATGQFSHAEGQSSALGPYSHSEGQSTTALGVYSHSEGFGTTSTGIWSHAEGNSTTSTGNYSHSEGQSTTSIGLSSHAEGQSTTANGPASHSEGLLSSANGSASHSEGYSGYSIASYSHAEGHSTRSEGQFSHSEGHYTTTLGDGSHSEGFLTISNGDYSHAEGYSGQSIGDYSHVEGASFFVNSNVYINYASITKISFFDKNGVKQTYESIAAISQSSFAINGNILESFAPSSMNNLILNDTLKVNGCYYNFGISSISYSSKDDKTYYTFGPSYDNFPVDIYSVSGCGIYSVGKFSHAEGVGTTANGDFSHAEGLGTVADGQGQHVSGRFNTTGNTTSISVIGNGLEDDRSDLALFNPTGVRFNGYLENGAIISANGMFSHAEGTGTISSGDYSHSEGAGFMFNNEKIFIEDIYIYQDDFGTYGGITINQNGFSVGGCYSLSAPYTTSALTLYNKTSATTINVNFNYYTPITVTSVVCNEIDLGVFVTTFTFENPIESVYYQVSGDSYVRANGLASHAEGLSTIADGNYQHVSGKYNISGNTTSLFVIGNGTDNNNRSDIVNVNEDGALVYGGLSANTLYVTGLTQTSGITSTGGITFPQKTINSTYTATTEDYMIDITGGTFNVQLPTAVGVQGKLYAIKNNGGGAVTIYPYGSEKIDDKSFLILSETNAVQLVSNGSQFVILGQDRSTVNNSTGVFQFTGLSKVSSTQFAVAPVKGWIVDDTTNPLSPQILYVSFTGGTFTDNYVFTANETYVYLTSGGTIQQQTTQLTEQQRRQNIFLGKLGHPDRTTINLVFSQPDFVLSPLAQLRDIFTPINLINGGVYPSANTGLTINTSAGYLYGLGINFSNDTLQPNAIYLSGTNPCTFQYRTQTGGTITNVTNIDPTKYDVGGAIVSVGGGSNSSTNQRIFLLQNGTFRIQYGQTVYSNLSDAIAGAQSETFTTFPNFVNNAILIAILSINKNATDLSNSSQARFLLVSKFGESVGAAGGISTTNLQQAYNNSTNPEIIINSTLDGLTIENGTGSADNVTNLLEGKNTAGTTTSFMRADGLLSGSSVSTPGFTANSNGLTATTVSATTYQNVNAVTGGSYSNGTITLSGTGSVNGTTITGFSTSTATAFTGGTVTGATNFTNGLTADTISATTITATNYQNLPSQSGTGISAFSYSPTTGLLTITKNDTTTITAGTFSYVTGSSQTNNVLTLTTNTGSSSTYTPIAATGGTYDSSTGIITLSGSGSPGTIPLGTDFITAVTETANVITVTKNGGAPTTVGTADAVTGGTYSNGVITLSGTGTVNGNQITGLGALTPTTLYSGDGTLSGNRVVDLSTNTLSFSSSTSVNNLMLSGGSVAIGTATPTNRLTVSAVTDPVRFIGLNGASDSLLLTTDLNGVVHTLPTSSVGLSWNNSTATQAASTNNGYVATAATLTTITLPTSATFGTTIEIVGNGTGLWRLSQNANQKIHFGIGDTTTGTGGYLSATSRYDCVRLLCTTTDTDFTVLSSIGNIFYT